MNRKAVTHEIFDKVTDYFKKDKEKIEAWYNTMNPGIGFYTPFEMIKAGRQKKLLRFVDNLLRGS